MDVRSTRGGRALDQDQRPKPAVRQSRYLREETTVDERCDKVRLRLTLDQNSVVDEVVARRQPAHLDGEKSTVAEASKQRSAVFGMIDQNPMHRDDDDGIVPRDQSSGRFDRRLARAVEEDEL